MCRAWLDAVNLLEESLRLPLFNHLFKFFFEGDRGGIITTEEKDVASFNDLVKFYTREWSVYSLFQMTNCGFNAKMTRIRSSTCALDSLNDALR